MPVIPSAKRTRTAISEDIKQQICVYATKPENKNKTQQQIADYFNQQYQGLHIDRTTISKILGKKAKWLALVSTSASKKTFRHREVKYPQVEKALGLWIENANANNIPVSEMMIKEKAFYFANEFNIPREHILFSNGWIEKFKRRNNIRCYRLYGEANGASLETLFEERRKLQTILQDYTLDNIFNADEIGLHFRMTSNQTLASAPASGTKRDKTRITVLIATNANGTQKLKPLVIGSSKNPRCLHRVNKNSLPCTYYANSKAWMRNDIFGEWLEYINNKFQTQNRKIILLIDNASSHFNPDEHTNDNLNLSHVRVHFLPPNTTAHLQPMDAGIIKSFKAIYKQHYIRHIIHQFEANVDLKSARINVKETMEYVAQAWDSVKAETIVNCWQKTGILPTVNDNSIQQALIAQEMANQEDQKGVNLLLQKFSSLENVSDKFLEEINQYLEMIDLIIPTEQPLTDAEIIQLILEEENEKAELNDDDNEQPAISIQEGFNCLKTWVRYFEEQDSEEFDMKEIKIFRKYMGIMQRKLSEAFLFQLFTYFIFIFLFSASIKYSYKLWIKLWTFSTIHTFSDI
ncbi:tigger transposable element-derived protein 6-like [Rhizophagus clarus]|uniref:Tigger transposable element-derived protein 6-like n=1 Tax=Rhizophagus clarus TaxID=94130 RepID=A0A8H3QKZ2_9GLOM|nr:tigger transposable element-derived protein 6-like [Rhizophagus clarus]